jgi:hypothetical protein
MVKKTIIQGTNRAQCEADEWLSSIEASFPADCENDVGFTDSLFCDLINLCWELGYDWHPWVPEEWRCLDYINNSVIGYLIEGMNWAKEDLDHKFENQSISPSKLKAELETTIRFSKELEKKLANGHIAYFAHLFEDYSQILEFQNILNLISQKEPCLNKADAQDNLDGLRLLDENIDKEIPSSIKAARKDTGIHLLTKNMEQIHNLPITPEFAAHLKLKKKKKSYAMHFLLREIVLTICMATRTVEAVRSGETFPHRLIEEASRLIFDIIAHNFRTVDYHEDTNLGRNLADAKEDALYHIRMFDRDASGLKHNSQFT